jgi:hypothetical protein
MYDPHNPYCPPAWRWHRACRLVENGRRPSRIRDDDRVREAVRFCRALRRCQDEHARTRLARKMPALYLAWQMFQETSWQRWELEARFLAREDTPGIARKCDLPPAAIDLYHDLFFAVRGRLHASDWVACRVIGPRASQGLTESDTDVLLKEYGYKGGPFVVDTLVDYFKNPIELPLFVEGLDTAGLAVLRRLLIRVALLVRCMPADPANLLALIMLQADTGNECSIGTAVQDHLDDWLLTEETMALVFKFPASGLVPIPCKRPA